MAPCDQILIVVSDSSLHLFGCVRKRQEPVGVQTLAPEAAVKGEEGSEVDLVD